MSLYERDKVLAWMVGVLVLVALAVAVIACVQYWKASGGKWEDKVWFEWGGHLWRTSEVIVLGVTLGVCWELYKWSAKKAKKKEREEFWSEYDRRHNRRK